MVNSTFDSGETHTGCLNDTTQIPHIGLSKFQTIFFTIMFSFGSIIGLVGNVVVITVILLKRELRRFTNYFFVNLSISDILVLIVCIPTLIQDIHLPDEWIYGKFLCKQNNYYKILNLKKKILNFNFYKGEIHFFLEYSLTSVSSLTIILISFERYAAISAPLKVYLRLFIQIDNIIKSIIFLYLG